MAKKDAAKTEFGDWQTPPDLARDVCSLLAGRIRPDLVFEPNCGRGAFLHAAIDAFPAARTFVGLEIDAGYVRDARNGLGGRAEILHGDFFSTRLEPILDAAAGPVLLVGNPPWVTSATVTRVGGSNVPEKSNAAGLRGIDAITGTSNFEIGRAHV